VLRPGADTMAGEWRLPSAQRHTCDSTLVLQQGVSTHSHSHTAHTEHKKKKANIGRKAGGGRKEGEKRRRERETTSHTRRLSKPKCNAAYLCLSFLMVSCLPVSGWENKESERKKPSL
jgi:hypothetical protein